MKSQKFSDNDKSSELVFELAVGDGNRRVADFKRRVRA